MQIQQHEDRRLRLPPAYQARDRLDVNGVNREEKRRRRDGGGRQIEPKQKSGEQQSRERMEEHVDDVKRDDVLTVDPPLSRIGEQKQRPVRRSGPPRSSEVRSGENLPDVLGRPDPRVVADDGLVVVGESAEDAVRVDDGAGREEKNSPARLLTGRNLEFQDGRILVSVEKSKVEGRKLSGLLTFNLRPSTDWRCNRNES